MKHFYNLKSVSFFYSPEKGVVFYTHFPKLLRSFVIGQLEANSTLIMFQLEESKKRADLGGTGAELNIMKIKQRDDIELFTSDGRSLMKKLLRL